MAKAGSGKPIWDRILGNSVHQGDCLLWQGKSQTKAGHGRMFVGSMTDGTRRNASVHRLAWEHYHGPIPEDMGVLHECDTPRCVAREHLFLGTPTVNMADRDQKGRQARGARQGLAKLDDAKVRTIRELRTAGEPLKSLAVQFGVSNVAIGLICNRKTWKHVA